MPLQHSSPGSQAGSARHIRWPMRTAHSASGRQPLPAPTGWQQTSPGSQSERSSQQKIDPAQGAPTATQLPWAALSPRQQAPAAPAGGAGP